MKKKLLFWFVVLTLEGLPFFSNIETYCHSAKYSPIQIQKQDTLFIKIPRCITINDRQTLKVYDVLGNEVATLVNEEKAAGSYEVEFQSSVSSLQLASGVYYYQLRAGEFTQTKKMIFVQ
jgi:hypothetical protein